jgi:hypothetical protein
MALGLAVVTSGCSDGLDPVGIVDGGRAATAEARADTLTEVFFVPLDTIVFVSCANSGAGEDIMVNGTFQFVLSLVTNDHQSIFHALVRPHGVMGVGFVSGDTYSVTGGIHDVQSESLENDSSRFHFVEHFTFVGPGTANHALLQLLGHVTVNANGEFTAALSLESVKCR